MTERHNNVDLMAGPTWKESADPLFRGDAQDGPVLPVPTADQSVVRHILYLDGAGRETPYLSTTESKNKAREFASPDGVVLETMVPTVLSLSVKHISRTELRDWLVGKGKGKAAWKSAFEVATAARYVEEWLEHLLDFREQSELSSDEIRGLLSRLFEETR